MFLRVADTLIDLFITKLRQLDRIDQVNKLHSLDRSKLTHIASFEKVVKEMGISGYSFWIGRESKKLKWKTLTGSEKLVLFKNINILTALGETDEATSIQKLWKQFLEVNSALCVKSEEIW